MTPSLTPSLVPPGELILGELGIDIVNLIATISPRELDHYIAVENWLTDYEPKPDATNIEKVSGYVEAFYHLSDELSSDLNALKASFLHNLGNTYYALGNYSQAIDCHQQNLTIARELQDLQKEGEALGGLGNVYKVLSDYGKAIEYHQQSLAIKQAISDLRGEEASLENLGLAYHRLGDFHGALEFHHQYLAITRRLDNHLGEGKALCNFGNTLIQLEQYSAALECFQASLDICRKIGNRSTELSALTSLAVIYYKLGCQDLAHEFCDQALAMTTELGILSAKEC